MIVSSGNCNTAIVCIKTSNSRLDALSQGEKKKQNKKTHTRKYSTSGNKFSMFAALSLY